MASCEPAVANVGDKREERLKQVMLGDLPSDFLRVTPLSSEQQVSLDEQAALALQHQFSVASTVSGKLTITIVEAKLNKNYGLTRMDPYVRMKIGHIVYETHTNYNGAKNPIWRKNFNCFFISNETTIHIEIFDECAFHLDERIAWTTYQIPKSVLLGETIDEWIDLSGKLGEGKEGSINIVVTCQRIPNGTLIYHPQSMVTVVPYGSLPPKENGEAVNPNSELNYTMNYPVPAIQSPVQIPEEDVKQVIEMFPNVEEDIVKAVMESNRGNKDHTINALLELSNG